MNEDVDEILNTYEYKVPRKESSETSLSESIFNPQKLFDCFFSYLTMLLQLQRQQIVDWNEQDNYHSKARILKTEA
jgi:hypothetical protein